MIDHIIPQHQDSLTYLQKVQYTLFKNTLLISMVLFTSCATPPRITYEGERNQEGKYHGQGVITYSNGDKWEGEYKDGLPFNGQGALTFPDGEKYVGEFKDGQRNGQGTQTFADGEKYVGEFKDGLPNGQGTDTFPDGQRYVGEWKDGKRNGQGTYTFPDGQKYVGEFKDGLYDGKGVLFKVNGEIQSGTWVNDTFQKNWTIEAVYNFLRNKYPQFTGLNYSKPITSVSSQNNEVYLPPPPDNPSVIAVVDFTGNSVSDDDCRALTDRLRTELFNTKHYKVIEREMMEEIMEEQKFQNSGCVTDVCIVEIGEMIGVGKIVGGSISKVGRTYSVSSRIVSVETGKILKGATYDYKGEIDELLTIGMKMVAYELIK